MMTNEKSNWARGKGRRRNRFVQNLSPKGSKRPAAGGKPPHLRRLALESLEERALLAVIAGTESTLPAPDPTGRIEPTGAKTWVVTTTADPASWDTTDSVVSLREAISRAASGDKITFNATLAGKTITLSGTQLEIAKSLTIDASALKGGVTIDAKQQSRVFYIDDGTSSSISVALTALTVTGGEVTDADGGGIDNREKLTLTSCTISGNSASRSGGGIYNNGTLTLTNTIVAMNYARSSGNDINGSVSETSGNNMIGYNPLFAVAPVFDASGKLANTETLDLRLTSGSRAINAGSMDVPLPEFDLDGNARVYGGVVDIGAYEYQGAPASAPTLYSTVVNTLNDSFDASDGEWSLREALYWATGPGTITFAKSIAGGTILLSRRLDCYGMNIDGGLLGMTLDAQQKSRVMSTYGEVTLRGLTITGGKTDGYGGGINNSGTLTLTDCTISGNYASVWGGGIYSFGTLTLTNCTISGNSSAEEGGGIYNDEGTLTLTNCTISGNSAKYFCGGICNFYGTLTLTDCTISGNSASDDGGGIDNDSGTLTLTNTIVAMNYAGGSGNDICGSVSETSGNNMIGYNPLFVVAPVFDASGKLTNAETFDLRLSSKSRAINAGSMDVPLSEFDLDGNARVYGGVVDIGAYEFQGTPAAGTDRLFHGGRYAQRQL